MPAKFEVYDSAGNPWLTIDHRVLKLLSVTSVGTTATGEVTDQAVVAANTVLPVLQGSGSGSYQNPAITVNTGTNKVSWNYGSIPLAKRDPQMKLYLQVY